MLGWITIFAHFTADLIASFIPLSPKWANFIQVGTLLVSGVIFLLSVSEAYATARRRVLFSCLFGIPAIVYLVSDIWAPQRRWVFPTLLLGSITAVLVKSWRYYRIRSLSFYLVLAGPLVYAVWSAFKAVANPDIGVLYYLTTLFIVTGFLYFRYYKRFTPGVVTTGVSFVLWGLVFPVGAILEAHHMGPPDGSAVWNLPKFMVAFGMILTLFENETAAATSAARQYRSLFEGNLAAVYLSTLEGKLLDGNTAFVKMYGYLSKEEMFACHSVRLYAEPEDREAFIGLLQKQGHVINYECRQRKRDGSLFWILERATIFNDPSGRPVIEGTAIDITERKQAEIALKESEERFATIFRNSPVACGICSLEGVFLSCNAALEKLFGRPVEEIIGKTAVELGMWKSQDQRDQFSRRLHAEGSIRNLEIEFTDPAGHKHIGLFFGTLVRIGDQECIFGMQLDCTEQRELEAKFLQAQKMEAVGRLAGGVAHDFNNLLGVIGGYAELLEKHLAKEEKLRAYCNKILATTQRASSLTNQLLTFSRKEISHPAPLEPNRAIRELAVILQRLIGEDIEIALNLNATRSVVIDKTHFEQIIFNIAVNARDAMPTGGQLTITTNDMVRPRSSSPDAEGAHSVEIHIRDTGIGMDEATRLRAFEPFFTTKESGRGTGLGLSTVYGIVQQAGGDINIESHPDQGAKISISLPAIEYVEATTEQDKLTEPMRGSGHILLVEDEAQVRDANAEFLASIGYTVTCASSGVEALRLLARTGPLDLVITDVVMPKLSGPDFAARLLELRPATRLLFVSGYADEIVLKNGVSQVNTPFLHKPYTLGQLAAKIHEVLTAVAHETANNPTLAKGE
jgi:PAS domain S-box-containing protein